MKMYVTLKSFFVLMIFAVSVSYGQGDQSVYAGQEHRAIKSLSKEDIEALSQGRGWGFAKAAELNGFPGPLHVLELRNDPKLNLTEEQLEKIQAIHQSMKQQAITLGQQFIAAEKNLNAAFESSQVNQQQLRRLIQEAEQARAELRFTHLAAHLQTHALMNDEQIKTYNQLRGYNDDPCLAIPSGHDPNMWKKHHGCIQ